MSGTKYMIQLDGLRIIAVSLVMLGHYTLIIPGFLNFDKIIAYSGVDLFFVLSGFLITLILIKSKEKHANSPGHIIRQFYIRRFLRIFPLYYLVILLGIILHIYPARQYFMWLVTYTTNILTSFTDGKAGNYTHLWSLSVEEQFYIFFPVLLLFTPHKYLKSLFIILVVVGVSSRIVAFSISETAHHIDWSTYSLTPCCLDSFGLGSLLSYFMVHNEAALIVFLKKYAIFFLLPLLAAIIIFIVGDAGLYYNIRLVLFRFLVCLFCFWVIGMGATRSFTGLAGKFLENKFIVYLGKISYGIYVYHYFMFVIFDKLNFIHNPSLKHVVLTAGLFTITTIVISAISYRFFEKPIMNLKSHFEYN